MLAKFSDDQIKTLKANFTKLGRMEISSACSGSNVVLLGMHVLTSVLGVKPPRETFCCENVPCNIFPVQH